jgi:RNA polymerase sigma-70 factor (ECF subfamily)
MNEKPAFEADGAVVDAIRAGDPAAFAVLAARCRRQLHVHCYRMLGSTEDAEDIVQETLLRAWRGREGFDGRAQFRTWLLRIATNACLSRLERAPRRVVPQDVAPPVTSATPASEARSRPPWAPELPWLQPYPDALLDDVLVTRESIGLAFLAALQRLPPRQRAVLLLRDVLGASAGETATTLGISVAAANSALQRARSTLRGRAVAVSAPTGTQQAALDRFVDAWERGDSAALIRLLRRDARWAMPPAPLWFDGRDAIARLYTVFPISALGEVRMVRTASNRQPAAAAYIRRSGEWRLAAVHVLGVAEDGDVAEVTTFSPSMCAAFGLPPAL